jgi:hypothetical protein
MMVSAGRALEVASFECDTLVCFFEVDEAGDEGSVISCFWPASQWE